MSHQIDVSTGRAACMVTGAAPWHKLGQNVSQAQTSAEAIKLACLDWGVEKRPLFAPGNDGAMLPVSEKYALVRTDTGAPLGVVGKQYTPFQNEASFDFMDTLVDDKLAMYETAGSLKGGRRIWMMARLPRELRVAGTDDTVLPYVLLTNSHDGTSALRIVPTSIRTVCMNTLNLALREAGSQGMSIRHRDSLKARVHEAREKLGIITARVDTFQTEIDALARVRLTDAQAKDYFMDVFDLRPTTKSSRPAPAPVAPASLLDSILDGQSGQQGFMSELLSGHKEQTARQERANAKLLSTLMDNYHNSRNTLPGIEGTAWAVFNAASEFCDHQSIVRGKTEMQRTENRLASAWFGQGDALKQEAYSAALAMAQ